MAKDNKKHASIPDLDRPLKRSKLDSNISIPSRKFTNKQDTNTLISRLNEYPSDDNKGFTHNKTSIGITRSNGKKEKTHLNDRAPRDSTLSSSEKHNKNGVEAQRSSSISSLSSISSHSSSSSSDSVEDIHNKLKRKHPSNDNVFNDLDPKTSSPIISSYEVMELSNSDCSKHDQKKSSDFTKVSQELDSLMDDDSSSKSVSDYDSDDILSIPALLDSMTRWKSAGKKAQEGNDDNNDDINQDEDDEEEQDDSDYFLGIPLFEMSHKDLLLYMEKALNNGLPASPDLPRVKVSDKKMRELKMHLWMNGPGHFLQHYLLSPFRRATPDELLAALGFSLPKIFFEKNDSYDTTVTELVQMAVQFTTMHRKRLTTKLTIDKLVATIEKAKNIIVLTGAGISTSLGIPDFRSQSGLYTKLSSLGLSEPQEVFDLKIFRQDPSIFYSVAKEILPVTTKFSPTHLFIKLLQDKGKLLRNYTQNIDNLEHYAGILPEKLVQCHGSFATATCQTCGYKTKGENLFEDIRNQVVSRCPVCKREAKIYLKNNKLPQQPKKKTSKSKNPWEDNDSDSDNDQNSGVYLGLTTNGFNLHKKLYPILSPNNTSTLKVDPESPASTSIWRRDSDVQATYSMITNPQFGIMKPDITFFGEPLPNTFEETLIGADDKKCDLLLCIGTSLKVSPVSETVRIIPRNVVQVYISKTMITHNEFDATFLGACDDVVEHLCHKLRWKMKHPMAKNKDFDPYIEYLPEIATYEFHSEPIVNTSKNNGTSSSASKTNNGNQSNGNSSNTKDEVNRSKNSASNNSSNFQANKKPKDLKPKERMKKPTETRQSITDKIFGKNMPKNTNPVKNKQLYLNHYFSK